MRSVTNAWGVAEISKWGRMFKKLVSATVAVAFFGVVFFGLVSALLGSVPDEAKLVTLTGRLDSLRIQQSFEFTVTPAGGQAVAVHMRSFAVPNIVARLRAAQSKTVTVRYRDGLLGRPVYAILGPDGDIVTFAAARAVLEAEDERKRPGFQQGLVLYGGSVLLMLCFFLLKRRSRHAIVDLTAANAATVVSNHELKWLRIFVMGFIGLLTALIVMESIQSPGFARPIVGVFGPRPLGLSPVIAAPLLIFAGALAPMGAMLWHLLSALNFAHRRDGVVRSGKFAMISGIARNWSDTDVRRHGLWALGTLAVFLLLMGAWIMATSRVGV
jgi:hypothetical protein